MTRPLPYTDCHTHLETLNASELAGFTKQLYSAVLPHKTADKHLIWNMGLQPSLWKAFTRNIDDPLELYWHGIGFHPWNVAACSSQELNYELEIFDQLIEEDATGLIGEIGLDFSTKYLYTQDNQRYVLDHILKKAQKTNAQALSLHAVKSTEAVLDMLEQHGILPCSQQNAAVIFHWFSGNSQELYRARKLGCYFSINQRMLQSKKGRAYLQSIEPCRLLLESDELIRSCQGDKACYQNLLESSLQSIAEITHLEQAYLQDLFADTSRLWSFE